MSQSAISLVGLYPHPPQAAMVLCVDEQSSIQALDRAASILPLLAGTPQRTTHDDTRHGVTNLYAALAVASGNGITEMTARHRAAEFNGFSPASTKRCLLTWSCR
jgi:hypothetical protein